MNNARRSLAVNVALQPMLGLLAHYLIRTGPRQRWFCDGAKNCPKTAAFSSR